MTPTLTATQLGWLSVVLVIWATLLFGGYFTGRRPDRSIGRMPRRTRLASSFVLVVASWSLTVFVRQTPAVSFALLIATGMTFGFLGDLFMAGVIPTGNGVLGGMSAFGLGHVAYITGGMWLASRSGLDDPAPRLLGWLAWFLIGLIGWYVVVFRGQHLTALHWAALPYSLLLASTAGVATGLAIQNLRLASFALGAGLFLFSDLMIAEKMFAGKRSRTIATDDLVWLTYGPGQMLIVCSICAVTL